MCVVERFVLFRPGCQVYNPDSTTWTKPKNSMCEAPCRNDANAFISTPIKKRGASLVAQLVKDLAAIQDTPLQFLGWEDSLEKG